MKHQSHVVAAFKHSKAGDGASRGEKPQGEEPVLSASWKPLSLWLDGEFASPPCLHKSSQKAAAGVPAFTICLPNITYEIKQQKLCSI